MNEQLRSALRPVATELRRRQNYVRPVSQILLEIPGGDDVFLAAQRQILMWMKPRARVDLPPDAWAGKSFNLDDTGAQPTEAVAIDKPRYWAARLKDADKAIAQRDWTIEISLAQHSPSLVILGVRTTVAGTGEDIEFARTIPNFVRQIADKHDARLDGRQIGLIPGVVTNDAEFGDLLDLIEDQQRQGDVIVYSLSDGETDLSGVIGNPRGVQRRLLGASHVFILTSPMSYALTRRFGKEWSVFNRAVRTYRPRFDPFQDNLRHHPLALPQRILDWSRGPEGYEDFLVDQSLSRTVSRPDPEKAMPSFLAVRQAASQIAIERAQETGSSDRELAELFSAQAEELKAQLAKQKEDNDSLLIVAQSENDNLKEEIEGIKARLRSQSARIEHMHQAQRTVGAAPDAIPTNLEDVQEWCDANLSGAVVVMPRAYRGLKDCDYEDEALIYRALLLLRDFYAPMRRSGGSDLQQASRAEPDLTCFRSSALAHCFSIIFIRQTESTWRDDALAGC